MKSILFLEFNKKLHREDLYNIRCHESFLKSCTWRSGVPSLDEFEREIENDFSRDRIVQYMMYRASNMMCVGTIWLYKREEDFFVSVFVYPKFQTKGYSVRMFIELFRVWKKDNNSIEALFFEAYTENMQSNSVMQKIFEHVFSKNNKEYYKCDRERRDSLLGKYDT